MPLEPLKERVERKVGNSLRNLYSDSWRDTLLGLGLSSVIRAFYATAKLNAGIRLSTERPLGAIIAKDRVN